jgi:hypothetical protein
VAQDLGPVERVGDVGRVGPGLQLAADQRAGGQFFAVDLLQRRGVAVAVGKLRVVAPEGVLAVHVHLLGRGDFGVAVGVVFDRDGVGGDGGGRHPLVQQGVDEGGVGAVLEQAADQIGQQVLMPADGGVGAHGHGPEMLGGGVIEGLAHAVQRWNSIFTPRLLRHAVNGGQRMGVVGRELGIEVRRGVDHGAGADEVVEVGRGLGREDRIVGAAEDLGALDLGVPVGALDQTDHQAAAGGLRQVGDAGDRLGTALLIGLNGEAEAGPRPQLGLVGQPVQQLQRQGEAVGLFRVHGEVDVVRRRDQGQSQDARIEFGPDAVLVRRLIAGRQGRELDRDAVADLGPCPFAVLPTA